MDTYRFRGCNLGRLNELKEFVNSLGLENKFDFAKELPGWFKGKVFENGPKENVQARSLSSGRIGHIRFCVQQAAMPKGMAKPLAQNEPPWKGIR